MKYPILLLASIIIGYFCLPFYAAFQIVIFIILLGLALGVYIIYKALDYYEKFLIFKKKIFSRRKIKAGAAA